MDNKRDIYNLWVQYTTKNEESYFREFIARFVLIWHSQLPLDFNSPECLYCYEVKPDSGPHLGRLPDELLPAIGKFIIVASDTCQNADISKEVLEEIKLLIDCLVIICRHFDNILAIIKYEYKSNLISILTNVFKQTIQKKCAATEELQVFRSFSQFLEVMYDPYLTWRSYLRNVFADYTSLPYKPHNVHVEIIPFIYDCFQYEEINRYPVIAECLIHALGAIISGSQKYIITDNYNKTKSTGGDDSFKTCDNMRNGMRAICPATVSVIMKTLSRWECTNELRIITLRCYSLMIIVLQKSSPEERQIDLVTLIRLYYDMLENLVNTEHFHYNDDAFHISSDNDANDLTIDVYALESTVNNICVFLMHSPSTAYISEAIEKTNTTDLLISIPKIVKNWNMNYNQLIVNVLHALAAIVRNSSYIDANYNDKIRKLFEGLTSLDCSSSIAILEACVGLAFDDKKELILLPGVLIKLMEWMPHLDGEQQNYLSEKIYLTCIHNSATKSIACKNRTIKSICDCLQFWEKLTDNSIQYCIKLIEELSKVSILPIELKSIFNLLHKNKCCGDTFRLSKQLLQTLVTVSLQSLIINNSLCTQYFEFFKIGDGIVVKDIKNWSMSGSGGFIFHILVRLRSKLKKADSGANNDQECLNCRRMLLNLRTANNTGFEVFVQNTTGNIVVATLTKREYLTSSTNMSTLLDNKWHYITVAVTTPKRPFSYSQINVYVDFMQKLSTTLKVQIINETFIYCSVASALEEISIKQPGSTSSSQMDEKMKSVQRPQHNTQQSYKGVLPSLLERTLSTNVTNYFTLPLRSQTSYDPNVKNFPLGMQNTVYGQQQCFYGQVGGVLLAESTTNLKTIFDAGAHFASIFSQDSEIIELTTRFVFCYAPGAYMHNMCTDLIPSGKYVGVAQGQYYRLSKICNTINSIGGIQAILPILRNIIKEHKGKNSCADINAKHKSDHFCVNIMEQHDEEEDISIKSFEGDQCIEWDNASSNFYTEWKISRSPVASFICLLRYLIYDQDNNQDNVLNSECLPIIGIMLQKCCPTIFDVNALMAIHLLIECLQTPKPSALNCHIQIALLDKLYTSIVFNFDIWVHMNFEIILGHIQYISAMIKSDRKYFRKKFGVKYFLDVTQVFYGTTNTITSNDAKTIRSTLFSIIRFYLMKDVNIKEIHAIIAFLASVKEDGLIIEFMDMLTFHIKSKNCRDQLILLMHEPQTANLLYNYFTDKDNSCELQEGAIKLITTLLDNSHVHHKYKWIMRLHDPITNTSLFPGFLSYVTPVTLSSAVIYHMLDSILSGDIDYCGLIYLIYHASLYELPIKLEVAKRLLQITFVKQHSPQGIAKQLGWQEAICRLLIKKPIINVRHDEEKRKSFGIDLSTLLEDEPQFRNSQADLISFCEEINESDHEDNSENVLNELQASVTEAANVLETEIKELAESVSGAVVENVSSVFSVIRQTTYDIQDTFESLTLSSSIDSKNDEEYIKRNDSLSSENSSQSAAVTTKKSLSIESHPELSGSSDIDSEEQLVYLVSNVLFTILWRGVSHDQPNCWKERGQLLGWINLLALNNELVTSHLTLRLKILEMAVQASLSDLTEHSDQTLINQENASYILRMIYDLVVLGSNEDDTKKCSTKLLDGVLALSDALMIFQQDSSGDWSEMVHLSLGLLLKCSHHSNPGVVAMATAKLHAILKCRNTANPNELAYLLFSINKSLNMAIEVGNTEQYSFLMPVMKALLEKCYNTFNLSINLPDLPQTTAGPVFFNDFQLYIASKKWKTFIEKIIQPLYDSYQRDIETNLWEPINRYWAECYEACKLSSKKRNSLQADNRTLYQKKILLPWKVHKVEEASRLQAVTLQKKRKFNYIKKKWKNAKRFLYGPRGPWFAGETREECWTLSNHENTSRMRLKLEPQLYPKKHENASKLRDNATHNYDSKEIPEFDTTIKHVVVKDFHVNENNAQLEEDIRITLDLQSQKDFTLEKLIITQECELITLMTKVKGRIEVNQTLFTFVDLTSPMEDGSKHDFIFSISKIREVHLRKYNLRRSALEIFLTDQTSYFLNFSTKTRNKIFSKILSLQPPNILYGSGRSPAEVLKTSGLMQKWLNREISNFEYLMYLNTIAGRSYNDLSQYPVFPWILADYSSDILDLTNPKSFRDLSKPIGVVNPKNEAEVRSKYESFEDPSGAIPKFHYGTHYSNSAGVLHYLLRVEPFTSLHIELQSGRFDVADRQFHSIPQTWKLLMDNPNDVKELIPEFFYFPEFLKNMNKLDLGHLQISKEKIDDVILPPWATTPEEFIAIHRRALESEFVSQNLHHWIDLIFGYKQKGPKAVEALNVFYYCTYEGAVDLDKINNAVEREAVEGMINNFGQVPSQLMREPHPRRLTHEEVTFKLLSAELKRPDLTQFLDKIVQYYVEISTPKDPIVYLSPPRSPPRSFLQLSPDILVSISKSCTLGCNSWLPYDKEKGFLLEVDATTTNIKNRKRIFGPLHPSQMPHSQLFAVSTDGKLLYVGGIWDNSLRVYNVHKGKTVASVTRHFDIITCLALDNCGSYLVTGSRDCTCIIWSIENSPYTNNNQNANNISLHALNVGQNQLQSMVQLNTQNNFSPKPLTTLYGHDDTISSVAIYTELDMICSGSLDGTVNVYTIQNGQFIRTLRPTGCTEYCVQISYVALSYHGHIVFSALDDASHSIHVYSINGISLGSKYVSGRVTGVATASDYLVVTDDAGDITISRLHGLKPVFDIPLHVPIQTVIITPGNTHILAPLRDGRLAVIAAQFPLGNTKKHSVLNV